jgi:ATP-dependent Lhr-like helicase
MDEPLASFHPAVSGWFRDQFGAPSPPQALGWPSISAGKHTLILAPTGSGKTLAAFLWCLNHIIVEPGEGVQVLYVSPLKALNYDVEKNLDLPLSGIAAKAAELGLEIPDIRKAVRTGDTSSSDRGSMLRRPPQVLITTPESLYLLLTSQRARRMLAGVRYLIVDEIHAVAGTKRGVHLAVSIERLEHLVMSQESGASQGENGARGARLPASSFVRIGLSATQRPLSEIASFLGGAGREVNIVDAGQRKELDLSVVSPVETFKDLPDHSAWNGVYQRLLEYIRRGVDGRPPPKTTLVFVNNRGVAERVTANLNELAGEEIARTHHGSLSKERRLEAEEALKRGQVPAIVATSSLELGIDMGSIDLVVQIGSPKAVSRGLQRIGRAGHRLDEVAVGRVLPVFRSDVLEATVTAREMRQARVEETRVPRNCLDVLAQQVCAMSAEGEWSGAGMFDVVRRAYPYQELTRAAFDSVLEMLSGRYPSHEFGELRPRIAWDRQNDKIRARDGSRMLAIINGGTIPDRGYYGVYLADSMLKLGELDEEMVFESRVGQTFTLGNANWRIEAIGHDRVLVTPAPPGPAQLPFWHGEGPGRPFELGQTVGEVLAEAESRLADAPRALPAWLEAEFGIDKPSAANLAEFLAEQRDALGALPNRKRIIIERFEDELGEPRVVVHSPFGERVNGALAFALSARIRESTGMTVEQLYTDDGIVFRFPAEAKPPAGLLRQVSSANVDDLVVQEIGGSAMFGTVFRQNAARALLLPRQSPNRRTPLWLQRIKAADLLQVARKYESFPIVIETYRECLQEVLDVVHLRQVLEEIEAGQIEVLQVETPFASPFAAEMLFGFVMAFMYGTDAPRAERKSNLLSINRDLLAEVLDAQAMRELLEPAAIVQLEGRLQRTLPGWKAESSDELMEIFLRLVDLSEAEVAERYEGEASAALAELLRSGQVVPAPSAERRPSTAEPPEPGVEERFVAAEYASWFRAAREPSTQLTEPRSRLVRTYAANHGPFAAVALERRYGFDPLPALKALQQQRVVARGAFTPGGSGEEWCLVENLRQLHRQSLAILREQIEPREPAQFAAFLADWQGVSLQPQRSGVAPLRKVMEQLQGVALPMEVWEPDILHRRLAGYQPSWLDQLCASGELVWLGSTSPGGGKGKIAFYFRDEMELLLPSEGPPRSLSPNALRVREWLRSRGASFMQDIAQGTQLGLPHVYDALWELVWAGEATNDTFDPVRSPRRPRRSEQEAEAGSREVGRPIPGSRFPAAGFRRWSYRRDFRRPGLPASQGRWSLFTPGGAASAEEQAEAYARQLLARYGVVAREMAFAEDGPAPWAAVYRVLKRLEALGQVRRGYFVKGLSGAQFALPDAIERLRQARTEGLLLLNATDPANPYGALLPLDPDRRVTRLATNYVAFEGGRPALAIEGLGRDLRPLSHRAEEALQLLPRLLDAPARVRRLRKLEVETWAGERISSSSIRRILEGLGFDAEPQVMRLRPSRL